MAIRIPAEEAKSKRHLGRIRRRLRACLVVRPCKRGHAANFCMSLRGAERRGNPYSLQYHKTKRNTLGKYEKHDEFALSTTDLPGFSAGTRIAAPVCALVRNDRFGRYVRTRARVQCTTFLPGDADCRTSALQPQGRCRLQHVIARSEATWQSVLLAVAQNKKQYLGRIRKVSRIRPRYCQPAKFPCGDADCHTSVRTGSQ